MNNSNNTFVDNMQSLSDYHITENGALTHSKVPYSKYQNVYQLFALGGAYRTRSDEDCILLFKKAFEENKSLALKCLFYLRDIAQGQGERRFFRVCFKWLTQNHLGAAFRNFKLIPQFGRIDDLYCLDETPLEDAMYEYLKKLLDEGIEELQEAE